MSTEPGLVSSARALVLRDLRLLWRRRGDSLQPALFAVLVVVLFALGVGGGPQALSKVAAAVLWVPVLLVSLALGTPLLSLLGAVVAALTVGMRRSGILVALLALPLYVPVLVFGAGSVAASAQGLDATGALLLLAAGLVLAAVLAPLVIAAAIRIAMS